MASRTCAVATTLPERVFGADDHEPVGSERRNGAPASGVTVCAEDDDDDDDDESEANVVTASLMPVEVSGCAKVEMSCGAERDEEREADGERKADAVGAREEGDGGERTGGALAVKDDTCVLGTE